MMTMDLRVLHFPPLVQRGADHFATGKHIRSPACCTIAVSKGELDSAGLQRGAPFLPSATLSSAELPPRGGIHLPSVFRRKTSSVSASEARREYCYFCQ